MAGEPSRTRQKPCGHCGHEHAVVNGWWLRWIRERAGLTLRAWASRQGYSAPFISDVERNNRACPDCLELAYMKIAPTSVEAERRRA